MRHQVVVTDVVARPTLVVATITTWSEFPRVWRALLDEVWGYLRANGIEGGCRNVMLYRDDVPHVEVGVEARAPGPLSGRVTSSSLPAGKVAMTTHRGGYSDLDVAHRAVIDWCHEHGKQLAGQRWEVYGPHSDDPSEVWTEVCWLLV
jgi:effector-binding domain-containing protein